MAGYLYRGRPGLDALNRAILEERAGRAAIEPPPGKPRYGHGQAPHGTPAAAKRHARRGESLCQACKDVRNEYKRLYRARKRGDQAA